MRELSKPRAEAFNVVLEEYYFRGVKYEAQITSTIPFDVFKGEERIVSDVTKYTFDVKIGILYTFVSDVDAATLLLEK